MQKEKKLVTEIEGLRLFLKTVEQCLDVHVPSERRAGRGRVILFGNVERQTGRGRVQTRTIGRPSILTHTPSINPLFLTLLVFTSSLPGH